MKNSIETENQFNCFPYISYVKEIIVLLTIDLTLSLSFFANLRHVTVSLFSIFNIILLFNRTYYIITYHSLITYYKCVIG